MTAAIDPPAAAGARRYGGFWRRLSASALDAVLVHTGVVAVFGLITDWIDAPRGPFGTRFLVELVVAWLYYAALECSPARGTLGKLALDMRVEAEEGGRLSFGRASMRHWAKLLSGPGTLGFGFLAVAFDKKKRGLHDRVARAVVVRTARA